MLKDKTLSQMEIISKGFSLEEAAAVVIIILDQLLETKADTKVLNSLSKEN